MNDTCNITNLETFTVHYSDNPCRLMFWKTDKALIGMAHVKRALCENWFVLIVCSLHTHLDL